MSYLAGSLPTKSESVSQQSNITEGRWLLDPIEKGLTRHFPFFRWNQTSPLITGQPSQHWQDTLISLTCRPFLNNRQLRQHIQGGEDFPCWRRGLIHFLPIFEWLTLHTTGHTATWWINIFLLRVKKATGYPHTRFKVTCYKVIWLFWIRQYWHKVLPADCKSLIIMHLAAIPAVISFLVKRGPTIYQSPFWRTKSCFHCNSWFSSFWCYLDCIKMIGTAMPEHTNSLSTVSKNGQCWMPLRNV